MTLLSILIHPDPRLKKPCAPVARITPEIETLAADMLATMYDAPGVGLAAPQVGVLSRICVLDCEKDPEAPRRPLVMVNPEITWRSEALNTYEEGCLSIPEYYEEVERPAQVRVRYTDLDGKLHEEDAEGLFASCIQHEIDHLNGILFVDYLSKLKRDRVLKKFTKAAKLAAK
jgi:peptide deformylase